MDYEYIIIGICLLFFIICIGSDWYKEYFASSDTLLDKAPDITKQDQDEMDHKIDNSDTLSRVTQDLVYDLSGVDYLEDQYSTSPFDKRLNLQGMTHNDASSAQALSRSQHAKQAILGQVRSSVPFSDRIYRDELEQNERKIWWEPYGPDITFQSDDYLRPTYPDMPKSYRVNRIKT